MFLIAGLSGLIFSPNSSSTNSTEARNSLKSVSSYPLAQHMGTWLCVLKHSSSTSLSSSRSLSRNC